MKDATDLAETADAVMAVATDADVVTAAVSAITAACGSFFFSAAAAVSVMVADAATAVVSATTAACGSFFFSAAAAVSAMVADVATAMVADAATAVDADARQHNISCIGLKETESFFRLFSHIYL